MSALDDPAKDAKVGRYRKRPKEIEAAQWDGTVTQASNIIRWVVDNGGRATYRCTHLVDEKCPGGEENHSLVIETIEGEMTVKPDGYVIRGLAGEFYSIEGSIFSETYDSDEEGS